MTSSSSALVYPLAILLIGAGFFVLGLRRRARLGRPLDRPFATKLVFVSFGGASTLILVVYPALHVVFWHWMRGGPIEANLPIGYSTDALVLLLVVGAVMSAIHAFYSILEHLSS